MGDPKSKSVMLTLSPDRMSASMVARFVTVLEEMAQELDHARSSNFCAQLEVSSLTCLLMAKNGGRHLGELSSRELQIAHLVAQGVPTKCIATELKLSRWTIESYLRRIFGKLQVTTRAAMIAALAGYGLCPQCSSKLPRTAIAQE